MKHKNLLKTAMMLLVMMMFVSPSTARAQGNDPGNGSAVTSYGDVNEDGDVNILDVILVNQYLIGEKQLSDQGRINADVDNNKTIETTDALNILKRVVEMIPQDGFPLKSRGLTRSGQDNEESTSNEEQQTQGELQSEQKGNYETFTWWMDDVHYIPANDPDRVDGASVHVYVSADQGCYGYDFTPLINGKTAAEAGFEILEFEKTGAYKFHTFQVNPQNGHTGAVSKTNGNATAKEGEAILNLYLLPPSDAADGTVYEISFKDLNVGSKDGVIYGEMNTVNGHIIIGESNPVNVGGSGGDAGTGVAVSETLYGDVNVDGSVDNLDVTLINKYLLGTAELSEQGKKNADVDANGTIDTTDSLNILKCCLELIEQSEFPIK